MSKVDYQLDVKGRVKTYHANVLKRYVECCEPAIQCVMSIVNSEIIDEHKVGDGRVYVEEFLEGLSQESIEDVDINPSVREEEKEVMMDLLYRYRDILTDVPGITMF